MTFERINKFRSDLKSGKKCMGMAISYSDPLVTDSIADSMDYIWIENEHGIMSPDVVNGHLLACRARGVPGIVRLPGGGMARVKPMLDSGADGVILPQVRTVEEVRELVDDCRYPPLGHRGFGPRVPSDYFRHADADFVARSNESIFVAVMIETAEALAAIDEIVAVPGLDSVIIGPADLSWALGVKGEQEHPRVVTAMERIIASAQAAGCFVGCGMGPDVNFAFRMARRGAQWLQVGSDATVLIQAFDALRAAFKAMA